MRCSLSLATPPGGGYDLYGRLVGRFLGTYLPGHPTIVPQNMPGAGSLIAANWLYNVAPRDGTAIGIMPSATAFENLLGNAWKFTSARARARIEVGATDDERRKASKIEQVTLVSRRPELGPASRDTHQLDRADPIG